VVDLDTAHTMPVYDAAASLVYSSRADDVLHTIVAGRILMENRIVAGIDEGEIRANFRAKAHALKTRSLG